MNALKALFVIVTALSLTGCHDNPLTIGSSRGIDERLLGSWRYHEKKETGVYTLARRGGGEYFGRASEAGEKPFYFRGYFSTIDGVDILNIQEVGNAGADTYNFFTYRFTPQGDLILSSIDLDAKQNAPSFVLRREISRKMAEGKLKLHSQNLTRVK